MANETTNASKLIDKRTRELGDWRGKTLSKVREVIRRADPDIIEEWKCVKATNPREHRSGPTTGVSVLVRLNTRAARGDTPGTV
jgi:hypothetical protein